VKKSILLLSVLLASQSAFAAGSGAKLVPVNADDIDSFEKNLIRPAPAQAPTRPDGFGQKVQAAAKEQRLERASGAENFGKRVSSQRRASDPSPGSQGSGSGMSESMGAGAGKNSANRRDGGNGKSGGGGKKNR
jgi:hypothetical protein